MNTTRELLELLYDWQGRFVSSKILCSKANISRIAVWQHIKKLKDLGYIIEPKRGIGYKLIEPPKDLLNTYELGRSFSGSQMVSKVNFFESTTSTMDEARKILDRDKALADKQLIIASLQTQGRGRKDRYWLSNGDNIYASYIYLPKNLSAMDGLFVMFASTIAIVLALECFGVIAKIKWPNDVIIDNKKIAGVLVDVKSDINSLEELVVGLGVNVNWDNIPEEINATSTLKQTNKIIDRLSLLEKILFYLNDLIGLVENKNKKDILALWHKYQATLGKYVEVLSDSQDIHGLAKAIDEYGFLLVETKGGLKRVITSDSVRFV